jgi:hypothetical protein
MRKVICRLPEGGTISIDAGEVRRVLVGGDVVDLDQVLVQSRHEKGDAPARAAVTMADALGHHAGDHFEPYTEPGVQTSAHRTVKAAPAADQE